MIHCHWEQLACAAFGVYGKAMNLSLKFVNGILREALETGSSRLFSTLLLLDYSKKDRRNGGLGFQRSGKVPIL